MGELFWLSDAQMSRQERFFLKSHGKPSVEAKRALNGIIFHQLQWLALQICPGNLRAAYDPLQPVEAVEQERRPRPD